MFFKKLLSGSSVKSKRFLEFSVYQEFYLPREMRQA